MLERNELDHDDVVSIIFTATDDLTAEFPATAARAALGLGDVAAARRPGAGRRRTACRAASACSMHCYTERSRDELHHVYLEGAAALRDDLADAD